MNRLSGLLVLSLGCAGPASGSRTVDLLKLIDPARDGVQGTWRFEGPALATATGRFSRLQIPYAPPAEYDLRAVVERKDGSNSIVFGLVAGGRQFCFVLDAFERDTASGIDLVDQAAFPDNETAWHGKILENGKPTEVVCSVRKDRLRVTVGARKVVDWPADYGRASLFKEWKLPSPEALFLGSWTAPYHVHRLELVPVSGEGRPLR
jgi:hypothetical protein